MPGDHRWRRRFSSASPATGSPVTQLDWELTDPAGKSMEEVRAIRDKINSLVEELAERLVGRERDVS